MEAGDLKPFLNLPIQVVLLDAYFETVPCNFTDFWSTMCRVHIWQPDTRSGLVKHSPVILDPPTRSATLQSVPRVFTRQCARLVCPPPARSSTAWPLPWKGHIPTCWSWSKMEKNWPLATLQTTIGAVGAMKALKESGYRIPQGYRYRQFDNLPLGSVGEPALTTIRRPETVYGRSCCAKTHRSFKYTDSL